MTNFSNYNLQKWIRINKKLYFMNYIRFWLFNKRNNKWLCIGKTISIIRFDKYFNFKNFDFLIFKQKYNDKRTKNR